MRNLIIALLFAVPASATAEESVKVAVASNAMGALEAIADLFESDTGQSVTLSSGATGKHYAQIRHDAPYDVFIAADRRRPRMLDEAEKTVSGTRTTYALGRLVLWSPSGTLVDDEGRVLESDEFAYLALANPRLAPYGRAAKQVLENRDLWSALDGRRVMGENIAQAYQFVRSGNAPLGFVARSQLEAPGRDVEGSRWLVPEALHDPIEQQAVLLADEPQARDFLDYVTGSEGRAIFRDHGYEVP